MLSRTLQMFLGRHSVMIASCLLALAWTDIALLHFTQKHLPVLPFALLALTLLLTACLRHASMWPSPFGRLSKQARIVAGLSLVTWLTYCYAWWTQTGWTVGNAAWYLLLASSTILDFAGTTSRSATSPPEDAFPYSD